MAINFNLNGGGSGGGVGTTLATETFRVVDIVGDLEAVSLGVIEVRLSQTLDQGEIRVSVGTAALTDYEASYIAGSSGTTASVSGPVNSTRTLTTSWSTIWPDNSLDLGFAGSQEFTTFVYNGERYRVHTIVGSSYDANTIIIEKVEQNTGIAETLPVAAQAQWSDGQFGVWSDTNNRFEPATTSVVSGAPAIASLNQLSGTTWTVSTSTTPGSGAWVANTNFAHYLQEGNKRYYQLRFYFDNDNPMSFEVTGAADVVSVSAQGFSLGGGDFAARMVYTRRDSANVITVDRDNDNDVDTLVDITFTAIMS